MVSKVFAKFYNAFARFSNSFVRISDAFVRLAKVFAMLADVFVWFSDVLVRFSNALEGSFERSSLEGSFETRWSWSTSKEDGATCLARPTLVPLKGTRRRGQLPLKGAPVKGFCEVSLVSA